MIYSAKGAELIAWGKMGSLEKEWLQIMKAMEECTINAALSGDYGVDLTHLNKHFKSIYGITAFEYMSHLN